MSKVTLDEAKDPEDDAGQHAVVVKRIFFTSCLLLVVGIVVFCVVLHIWIGLLITTGINRADISILAGNFYLLCRFCNVF